MSRKRISKPRVNKTKNFFADNYRKCWNFLKEIRWYFVLSVGIFFFFFLISFAFPIFFREEIIQLISNLGSSIEGKNTFDIISYIFLNNTQASFFAFVTGITVTIIPIGVLIFNGYLLGFVANAVVAQEGITELWRILPHGIFELPAIFFSTSMGIKIGFELFRNNAGERLAHNYFEGLRFFLFVVVPLLIIAAIIEGVLIGVLK